MFATKVRRTSADVEPMKIVVDREKWRLPSNRAPPRRHSEEKQEEIRKKVNALLKLGVIKESQVTEWSQPTPEGTHQKWRFTLDYVRLNSATGALERWPIPNIQQIISKVRTLKPKVFGIIDFTTGYHQTRFHPKNTPRSLLNMDYSSGRG